MTRVLPISALTVGFAAVLNAGSLTCSLNTIATQCSTQAQILSNDPLNWQTAFGEATNPPSAGPWQTSNNAVNVTLTSPGLLQRADNTVFAWNGTQWTFPDFIAGENITTYQGQFGAPSLPTSTPPFGDPLLGVLGSNPLTISFSSPVLSAGFLISSRSLANFQANLAAYDSQNNLLGVYSILANGLGGVCAGLGTLNPNPTPCNDAPLVAFLESTPIISKLQVYTAQTNGGSDTNGFFIDTLYVHDVPEPSIILMLGSGLCAIGILLRKRALLKRAIS